MTLSVLLAAPNVHGYLNPYDEGQWLSLAQSLLSGQRPYQDVFFHYGPAFPWALKLLFAIAPVSLTSVRMLSWAMNLAALWIIYAALLRLCRNPWLRVGGAIAVWCIPLTAHVLTIPMAARYGPPFASILAWTRGRDRPKVMALAGAFAGLSFFFSQEGAAAVTLAGAVLAWQEDRAVLHAYVAGFAIGLMALLVAVLPWGVVAYVRCAFGQTAGIVFAHSATVAGVGENLRSALEPSRSAWAGFETWQTVLAQCVPALTYAFVILLQLRRFLRKQPIDGIAFSLTLFGSLCAFTGWCVPDRWHLFFGLTPWVVLVVYLADQAWRIPVSKPLLRLGTAILLIGWTLPWAWYVHGKQKRYASNSRSSSLARAGVSRLPPSQAAGYEFLVQWVQSHVASGRPFVFYPYDGCLYFLADRPNPSYFPILVMAATPAAQARVVNDFRRSAPEWLIRDTEDNAFHGQPIDQYLSAIYNFLRREYMAESSEGPFRFLKRI